MSFHRWIQRREYGLPAKVGDGDLIMKRIYTSIEPYHCWNDLTDMPDQTAEFGAVFNLEFSPEGNVLVAACEKKSILLFDAISTKQNHKIVNAHTDNVNCIKKVQINSRLHDFFYQIIFHNRFLDDRMFATCSDDTTVALWDLRYLKSKVRSLHGHSNWVKNIEYSHKDSLLVTSGFDGSIFTWDINSHTEQGLIYQKVFHTSGLMRCRITPDGSKLVICTTGGYLMIIHDLDLTTLHKDLCGFRPSIYRLMQMGHQHIPQAAKFDHVFSKKQKKNRVELVTDFPAENDAEVILALQIHPQGHSFLSRNISYDEMTEWSCIHDINEEPGDITDQLKEDYIGRKRKLLSDSEEDPPIANRRYRDAESGADSNDESRIYGIGRYGISRRHRRHRRLIGRYPPPPPPAPTTSTTRADASSTSSGSGSSAVQSSSIRPESFVPDIWAAEVTVQERAIRQNRGRSSNSVTGYNFVYAISSGVLPIAAIERVTNATSSYLTRQNTSTTTNNEDNSRSPTLTASSAGASTSSSDSPPLPPYQRVRVQSWLTPLINRYKREKIIFENAEKLMYFMKESNTGKGFIKEPCFSSDGRIICSPFEMGVRLLAFADDCSEYPRHRNETIKGNPKQLIELKHLKSHSDIVLCTKFSPREPLLVTGCRSGKVVWHHPNL